MVPILRSWPKIRPGIAALTLGSSLLCAAAAADTPEPETPEIVGEAIEVRVINLEVRVTDRRGRHVAGLTPDDFRLEIDGETVPIGYFSEIQDRVAVAAPGEAASSATAGAATGTSAESPAGDAVPAVLPGDRVGTNFLVFIDNYFAIERDRRPVLDGLRETVSQLGPTDHMAIVAYDGRQLEMLTGWTSSTRALDDLLRRAHAAPARGLERLAELGSFDHDVSRAAADLISDSRLSAIDEYIRRLSRQVEVSLRAAGSALRSLGTPPGRKVMLLVSGGWPLDPSIYAVGLNPQVRSRTRRFFPVEAREELVSTANLLGYTLYPIDMPGNRLKVRGISAAGRGGHIEGLGAGFGSDILNRTGSGPGGPGPVATGPATASDVLTGNLLGIDVETEREIESEAMLIQLAKETGGRALINSHRLGALERVLDDTSSYYWLGFDPGRRHDDQDHEIRVVLERPRTKVRSRRSFKDFSRETEVAMEVESQLLFGPEPGSDQLEVELGTPQVGRRIRQPVTLHIPLDRVVVLPTANGHEGQLELRVAAISDDGDRSEMSAIPVRFAGPAPPQPGQVVRYDVELVLAKSRQRLALALHDLAGGDVLSATVEFEPPKRR